MVSSNSSVAGQSVDNFPTEDVTVVLGGTAQLSCTPTVNGARTTVAWSISPPNGVGDITIINDQTVLGTPVFVGSEYRSPLVFTNASRELDGAIVGCRYDDGVNIILQPQQSRPTVTVLCEIVLKLHILQTTQYFYLLCISSSSKKHICRNY